VGLSEIVTFTTMLALMVGWANQDTYPR